MDSQKLFLYSFTGLEHLLFHNWKIMTSIWFLGFKVACTSRIFLLMTVVGVALLLNLSVGPRNAAAQSGAGQFIEGKTPGNTSVVVFIHGLSGDARNTWFNNEGKAYWPELIKKDDTLRKFDVYVVDYYSPLLSRAGTIEEVTSQVFQELVDRNIFRDYTSLVFITHSLGGLIAKNILVKLNTPGNVEKLRQVRAIIYIGTPAQGTDKASFASWLTLNRQVRDLGSADSNTFLQALENNWRTLIRERINSRAKYPQAFCAYETLPTAGAMIVSRTNASTWCDSDFQGMGYNHIDLVKPASRTVPRYEWTKARILDVFSEPTPQNLQAICQGNGGGTSDSTRPRLRVSVFKHGGTESDAGKDAFTQLQALIADRLVNITERLNDTYAGTIDMAYLSRLTSCFIDQQLGTDEHAIQSYLDGTHSLELISGALFREHSSVHAQSRVYFGPFGGEIKQVPIEMAVSRASFTSLKDIFSVVTLYALAMDAKRLNKSKSLQLHYLQEALTILKDIKQQSKQIRRLNTILQREASNLKGS